VFTTTDALTPAAFSPCKEKGASAKSLVVKCGNFCPSHVTPYAVLWRFPPKARNCRDSGNMRAGGETNTSCDIVAEAILKMPLWREVITQKTSTMARDAKTTAHCLRSCVNHDTNMWSSVYVPSLAALKGIQARNSTGYCSRSEHRIFVFWGG